MRNLFGIIIIIYLLLSHNKNSFAGSMFRSNTGHTGVYNTKGVVSLSGIKWQIKVKGAIPVSPAVENNVVFFGSTFINKLAKRAESSFYAVDTNSGEIIWKIEILGFVSSPSVVDGIVYFGGGDYFYMIDAKSGSINKKIKIAKDSWISAPAINNGMAYIGANNGLYAIDIKTGSKRFKFPAWRFVQWKFFEKESFSNPVAVNATVFFGSSKGNWRNKGEGNCYAIDALTGKLKWKFTAKNNIVTTPVVLDGTVYFGSYDRNLYALDANTGALKWKFETGHAILSSAAVYNGVVYFGSWDEYLYALDVTTGNLKWKFKVESIIESCPSIAEGIVYVGSYDWNLYAIDADTGQKKWNFKTDSVVFSTPAIADGVVYFGNNKGSVYALH